MAVVKMSYSEYKNEWDHCKTVRDSYNREDKTVDVKIPDYILQDSEFVHHSALEGRYSVRSDRVLPQLPDRNRPQRVCQHIQNPRNVCRGLARH